jgi:hypothetical protein
VPHQRHLLRRPLHRSQPWRPLPVTVFATVTLRTTVTLCATVTLLASVTLFATVTFLRTKGPAIIAVCVACCVSVGRRVRHLHPRWWI